MSVVEPELAIVARAFPVAQELLAGVTSRRVGMTVNVGWHDTTVSAVTGAAAVVRTGGPYMDLIGSILEVEGPSGSAFVYVVGRADVPADLSLARRAFLAIAALGDGRVDAVVEVVE